jgi:hypothetical protein
MKKRKIWNIEEFNKVNLPELINGSVNKTLFSTNNNIRVLDLPLCMPNQGWKIPLYLNQFKDIINIIFNHEKQYGLTDYYVYITVDQKIVQKGNTGRRAGAHSDAYIERDNKQIDVISENIDVIEKETDEVSHTYIITDILPTEFFNARFPLKRTDCESSMKTFNDIAEQSDIITYPKYAILKLDPYVIHRAAISDVTQQRTFVKVSFSKKKYSRSGNTVNPEFDYDWAIKERNKNIRNHPW